MSTLGRRQGKDLSASKEWYCGTDETGNLSATCATMRLASCALNSAPRAEDLLPRKGVARAS